MTALISERSEETEGFIARATTGRVGKSGSNLADGVLSGYEWNGGALTFAFPDSAFDYIYGPEPNSFGAINTDIKNAVRRVLEGSVAGSGTADDAFSVEGFTNLIFNESADHANADLRYARSNSANPTAYAYYPSANAVSDKGRSGDVWYGSDYADGGLYDQPVVGNYSFAVTLHETGHALGLKHGHQATSFDKIKTELHGRYDSLEYSVMTYHSYPGVKKNFYTNEEFGYPQTYMMADIRALQHMYGADFGANAGNTVYKWDDASGQTLVNGNVGINPGANRIFATIWDGAGIDTYDLSTYGTDVIVDLRPGKHSKFSDGQLVDLGAFDGKPGAHLANGNIYNALLFKGNTASLIENAIGGAGNDRLIGNGANNVLTGNGGNDTFFFRDKSHADTISDFGNGLDKINLTNFDIRNFNALVNKMIQDGGDVEIRLGGGDILTLSGHLVADFIAADFVL